MTANLVQPGLYVPIVTPFARDGSVAIQELEALARRLLTDGAAGIVALGTTGEPSSLEPHEKEDVIATCARACLDRGAPLIVGVSSNSTAAAVEAARLCAKHDGISAILCVVPYYVRPGQAGIIAHFRAVAEASSLPVVIYNIPFRTGRAIDPDSILELVRSEAVVGLKQSVEALDVDTLRILSEVPREFRVFCGQDELILPMTLLGGSGAISAAAHVRTPRFVAMIEAALAGRSTEARGHHDALLPVARACFAEPNPAVIKAALHAHGLIPTPDVRLPMTAASDEALKSALAAIEAGA